MRRFRPRLVPTLLALPVFLILLGLGTWQVQRLQWKTDLLQTMAERSQGDPIDLDSMDETDPAAAAWRRVQVTGQFVTPPGAPQRYGVESIGGELGSRLLGVFETEDGRALLVDRGFLGQDAMLPAEPTGTVTVQAILRDRGSEQPGLFTPANDLDAGRWYWLDMAAIGQVYGHVLEPVALQLLPDSPGATDRVAPPRIDLPNNHLGYVITWYGLAIALLVVYVAFSTERTERTS
jgi:surfeit locus 1 family protein